MLKFWTDGKVLVLVLVLVVTLVLVLLRLERLVDVLRKKVGTGSVRAVI